MTKLAQFIAPLTCPACGHRTEGRDNGTQTAILDYRDAKGLDPRIVLGAEIPDLEPFAIEDAYIMLRAPAEGEPVRILETWRCPSCRAAGQPWFRWAEVVFEGRRFASMRDRELSLAFLREVHFACQSLVMEVIDPHLGVEVLERYTLPSGDMDPGFIPLLAPHLPAR
ncbi:MAG: hypothetical protein H6716_26505 [Polyangiaceae bacterium]|nr:hypothetical protein [Polyangiaceae bacterium]MCB9647679.1 hypothetical protein [Deltaproteobacteria bacterium]